MNIEDSHLGYVVYAAKTITYDGSIPDTTDGEILAKTGVRGVIALIGHVEVESVRSAFLVCLDSEDMNPGNPICCWVEDLMLSLSGLIDSQSLQWRAEPREKSSLWKWLFFIASFY